MRRVSVRSLPLLAAIVVVLLLSACGSGDETTTTPVPDTAPTITPTPATTPSPSPTAALTDAEAQDGSAEALRPRPTPGGPCPVQPEICHAALDLYQRVRDGDIEALMANADPREMTCPDPGTNFGIGNSADACLGAKEGDIRPAYSVSSGGEGLLVGAGRFREALSDLVLLAATADPRSSDNYGFGDFRIAAVGCFRLGDMPAGECGPEWIEIALTLISHDESIRGEGLPGRRMLCLEMWWPEGAAGPGLTGAGCPIPPETQLYAFDLRATAAGDREGRFGNYPWTPAPEVANTHPTGTRTGDPAVDEVLEAFESPTGVLPPDLFEYTWTDCIAEVHQLGAPPECPPGVPEGSLVEAVPFTQCEGGWRRRDEIEASPPALGARYRPYAARRSGPAGGVTLVVVGPEGFPYALVVGETGIAGVHGSCGLGAAEIVHELAAMQGVWLLPPVGEE